MGYDNRKYKAATNAPHANVEHLQNLIFGKLMGFAQAGNNCFQGSVKQHTVVQCPDFTVFEADGQVILTLLRDLHTIAIDEDVFPGGFNKRRQPAP